MDSNRFVGDYIRWRENRLGFIVEKYGEDFFRKSKILELGSGLGHISEYFRLLGADVLTAEGRSDNIELAKEIHPQLNIIQLDQESDWNLNQTFDVIIHWGVLYHLSDWRKEFKCLSRHMHKNSILFIESEVLNSPEKELEIKVKEEFDLHWDAGLSNHSWRASASIIEKELSHYFSFERFDDSRLNVGYHKYDWVEGGPGRVLPEKDLYVGGDYEGGLRRFWICKLKENTSW